MVNETHQEGPQKGQRKEFDAKCVNQLLELTDDLKRAIDDGHEPHIKVTVSAISNILNQTESVPTAVSKQYSSLVESADGFIWDLIWGCADRFEKVLNRIQRQYA